MNEPHAHLFIDGEVGIDALRKMPREQRLAYAIRYAFSTGRLTCLHDHATPDNVCAGCIATAALRGGK